jgi:signal transduction histidine kinase
MRTAGKFLIFSAVFLRAMVVLSDAPEFRTVLTLLTAYGLLLLTATWLAHDTNSVLPQSPLAQLMYLSIQSLLVLSMLLVSNYEDFLAELFIPLSLDAVTFFGRRSGFRLVTAFSLAMIGVLLFSPEGPLFGLAMGVLYSGLCFVFGGYADQVQKAEAARLQIQRSYGDLQEAHRHLQEYTDHLASLAVERERSHLARDLHDSVTQTVFSMNLAAQSVCLLWDREPARMAGQLSRLEELATSAQREIQSLVSQLSPLSVTETGLPAALHRLALEQKSRNGLQVSLEVQGNYSCPETIATGLYAIAQEALTNIAKHSGCGEAAVRLRLEKDNSCLGIEDHGKGFDPQAISDQRGHLGLAGMFERAQEMGWNMSVESQPGQGTRIQVSESPAAGGPK